MFKPENWKIMDAPNANNIIWSNYGTKTSVNLILDLFNNIVTFSLIFMLSTVIYYAQTLEKLYELVFGSTGGAEGVVKPMSMMFVNTMVIPNVVYMFTDLAFFNVKSDKITSRLHKYFFYLVLNSLIIPVFNLNDMSELRIFFENHDFSELKTVLTTNTIEKSSLFLNFIV